MKEQQLVNQILSYLTIKGCYVWRVNTGAMTRNYIDKLGRNKSSFVRFGHKGISDILGIIGDGTGRMIACECKVGKNKPTQFQTDFLEEIKSRGGVSILAYSLEDVEKVI